MLADQAIQLHLSLTSAIDVQRDAGCHSREHSNEREQDGKRKLTHFGQGSCRLECQRIMVLLTKAVVEEDLPGKECERGEYCDYQAVTQQRSVTLGVKEPKSRLLHCKLRYRS
jgi:hypothetical protein